MKHAAMLKKYRIFRLTTRALSIQKRSKFVKNEHARYTLGMKKGTNLERLITATSQARFRNNSYVLGQ